MKESREPKTRVDSPGDDGDIGSPLLPTLVPVDVSSPEVEPTGDIKIEIHLPQAMLKSPGWCRRLPAARNGCETFCDGPAGTGLTGRRDVRADGLDGLLLKIQQALGRSPCDGTAYALRNRSANRIMLLVWDGAGV